MYKSYVNLTTGRKETLAHHTFYFMMLSHCDRQTTVTSRQYLLLLMYSASTFHWRGPFPGLARRADNSRLRSQKVKIQMNRKRTQCILKSAMSKIFKYKSKSKEKQLKETENSSRDDQSEREIW